MTHQERSEDDIRYANDAVDLEDGFGTVRVGDEVAKMILQVETPFSLGVVGKWGSGKTSVLRRAFVTLGGQAIQVEVPFQKPREDEHWNRWSKDWPSRQERDLQWSETLRECSKNSLCVWFSPWQHQAAENPLLPLLLEVRDQFSVKAKAVEALRPTALAAATLLERVVDGALILTGAAKRPVATGAVKDAVNTWREETADTRLDDGQRFQLLFEDAVDRLLRSLEGTMEESVPKGRLIIFVDDLDRCEESTVVRLLEAIKLYLGAPRCVFVLGIDESAVLAALGRHWKGRTDDDNREYLEKLFQAVVPVPVPAAPLIETWVTRQLDAHGFDHPEACAELLVDVIEPNPRKVKNFVNSLCAVWHLLGESVADAKEKKLVEEGKGPAHFERRFVLLQYLRLYHKSIWRLLERDRRILRIVTQVLTGVEAVSVDDEASGDFDPTDQKVLARFVFESFAHVLGQDPSVAEPALTKSDSEKHGHLSMTEAVELFGQRLDRKRSDQRFRMHYKNFFGPEDDLPSHFLHLREVGP